MNFLQGTLDILILTALAKGPLHGYDVVEWIRATTDETLAANETEEDDSEFALVDERRAIFCARVDPRTSCGPGSPVRLSVDPRRFHYFDPQTGLAITSQPAPVATA